jgi:pentapeptide repeat protein
MSYVFKERNPPPAWPEFKKRAPRRFLMPFYAVSWLADWAAYFLGRWPVVELLEYLGSFSILFAAIVYFAGASDRLKQKHYQAWQVINTAEGKGGNGGRIDALQELNEDHVSLVGVQVGGAYLQGLRLEQAQARRAIFAEADLRDADFQRASLPDADLHSANLRGANLRDCNLVGARLDDADLVGADFAGADLSDVALDRADLRDANLDHLKNWQAIKSLEKLNILGVRNAPAGFIEWARKKGAIEVKTE